MSVGHQLGGGDSTTLIEAVPRAVGRVKLETATLLDLPEVTSLSGLEHLHAPIRADLAHPLASRMACTLRRTFRDGSSSTADWQDGGERAMKMCSRELRSREHRIRHGKGRRSGRTLKHLIATIADLSEQGIGFKSVQENMDTTTPGGKLIFHIFGALAEFEREVIREHTNAGLQAARTRGRLGGRPTIQSLDPKKVALARKLYADEWMPVQEICATFHIGRSTLFRYIQD